MDIVQLLQKLIQIYSPSGKEKKLADFILLFCLKNNIPVKLLDGNIIIYLRGRNKKKALIFNAHLDTVIADNDNSWKYPPYGKKAGVVFHGKMYGLGASDDKGAIVSMLLMAKTLIDIPFDIWITFVCEEETDGSGTEHFLNWFCKSKLYSEYDQIAAIIAEPTNLNKVEIGHRGNAFIKLTVSGQTGHGAKTYQSENLAINKMLIIIEKLQQEFYFWKKKFKHEKLGEPSLNITSIHTSNSSINAIPAECIVTFDIRTTPNLHERIESLMRNVSKDINISYLKKVVEPAISFSESQLIKIFQTVFPKLPYTISIGSSDLVQFIRKGIDAIVFGPGDNKYIHTIDENVELSDIYLATKMYKEIISRYGN